MGAARGQRDRVAAKFRVVSAMGDESRKFTDAERAAILEESRRLLETRGQVAADLEAREKIIPLESHRRRAPEPKHMTDTTGDQWIVEQMTREMRRQLDEHADKYHEFNIELLGELLASIRGEIADAIEREAKTLRGEISDGRIIAAQIGGKASGEVEALRAELDRAKAQVEELRREVEQLRERDAKSNVRRLA